MLDAFIDEMTKAESEKETTVYFREIADRSTAIHGIVHEVGDIKQMGIALDKTMSILKTDILTDFEKLAKEVDRLKRR